MGTLRSLLPQLAATLLILNLNVIPVLSQNENATTTSSSPSSGSEGTYNTACNTTSDCKTDRSLLCLEHICHCAYPQVYDLRLDRCVIPLGKPCDSTDVLKGDKMCPEFGECFLDRCVCKTGYSMHTLTRCKSDLLDVPQERKPIVLWPRETPTSEAREGAPCTNDSCDASKGLSCQDGQCKCIDSKELFIEEFGRCLNSTLQNSLKEALKLVSTSEDEIKSFVKLLEKFDEVDQHTGNSDHYNSPVHQLLTLLSGGRGRDSSTTPTTRSQVAPPNRYLYDGDLQHAAQETVTETTVPMSSTTASDQSQGHEAQEEDRGPGENGAVALDPIPSHAGDSVETSGEGAHYTSGSQESIKKPGTGSESDSDSGIHLDNFNYQGQAQGQEPAIVQRQAPPYLQGEGIPLEGIGTIPQNHYRLPINQGGLGGFGGLGGLGGGYGGGLGGLGQGGFGQGLGLGGLGGHGLGGLGGFRPGFGLGGLGFGRGGGGGGGGGGGPPPPPPQGGRGPPGGGPPPPPRESLLQDLAEFIGRSLKLMDRFLPLIHVIQDTLKKEGLFDKKEGLLGGVLRDRRFGEQNKEGSESEALKEGGIMSGVARFIAILMRLKNRLNGDVVLKKLLSN